jgi:hypothetical protein
VLRTAPRSYSRAPVAACDSRVSAWDQAFHFMFLSGRRSVGLRENRYSTIRITYVWFLGNRLPGVLPEAPVFGPSPARQGSASPLRALDRLLPAQLPGLYRGGRPNEVRRPKEANELCCYFK